MIIKILTDNEVLTNLAHSYRSPSQQIQTFHDLPRLYGEDILELFLTQERSREDLIKIQIENVTNYININLQKLDDKI